MPSFNNWYSDGTEAVSPNRAERVALADVLREHLTMRGCIIPGNTLPAWMYPTMDPQRCSWCYGGVRAVVAIRNQHRTEHNACMRCAADNFRQLEADSHMCSDCRESFTGPLPSWASFSRSRVLNVARGAEYPLCRPCSGNYVQCPDDECGTYYHINRQAACHEPVPRCSNCSIRGTVRELIESVEVVDRYAPTGMSTISNVCTQCHERRYSNCRGCDRLMQRRDGYRLGTDPDAFLCLMCAESDGWMVCTRHGVALRTDSVEEMCCNPHAQIHNYSYRPPLKFYGDGPLFLGAEIEICARNIQESASVAGRGFKGIVYLKDDASVSSGFEMVTHPMSFRYWMESFPWDTFAELRASGAYEHHSCGIHVHAARDGFSGAAHQHRWLAFFDRNQRMIERVARRSESSYAQFGQLTPSDKKKIATKEIAPGEWRFQRYSAVNCNNRDTFEVRIFATSIDAETVKGSIAFVAASIEYTRQLKARDVMKSAGMQWDAFREWVDSRPEYAALSATMIRVGA